jgi:hypothetical protein
MTSTLTVTRFIRTSAGPFGAALVIGWVVLAVAASAFARSRNVPLSIALPLALAFLTEYSFYLLLGFAEVREYLETRFTRPQLAMGITLSGLLPYFIYSVATGGFTPSIAGAWMVIMGAVAFWFLMPVRAPWLAAVRDLVFLALLAAVILSGVLRWIFPAPLPKLPLEVLGHVILIRSAILTVLFSRRGERTGIGFLPDGRDVWIGVMWFAACAVVAVPIGFRLGQFRVAAHNPAFWPSLGLLAGMFWVLALSEEFFFRGLLQQWLTRWTHNAAIGLILGSLLFAGVHLGFRNAFPNWRFAALSAILGLACGASFLHARNIRASMVTHALAVSAWRLFLA